ncbi:alpha-L-arabinofuranosidase C-terminal domain-containing protein [Lacipirellula parvula]|uniref:non-reducing end alpha-L-arabinofuranosidase n=1 Tax=Lacipirellula parvula TaxID=2650471 RepID=A0A5K7XNE2_9BACT|nr:alpha-L-arabinofuranosidase C-terminal domain-containing protein [Lacipirellula parvula]BBO34659.1 alpha-L-arabinofuranosidase [Lacipirellula parvula]
MARQLSRRDAVKSLVVGATAATLASARNAHAAAEKGSLLQVDLTPRFELSPYLYMQFMEPLGVTDSSVEASWDHLQDRWRPDLIAATQDLAPTMMRWGGIFTDFYRWREGVGPRDKRPPMVNLMWGGLESNQIGTAEFIDFCRQVKSEPLMCVNFAGDGRKQYREAKGSMRWGDAQEAADWVAYCNDPDNAERRGHGFADPLTIRYWQLGNETSYDNRGFNKGEAIAKTIEFSKAMRQVDPSIQVIAWGDSGWAADMYEQAGDHVDMLAFHQMFNPDSDERPVLRGELYRRDPAATWDCLMNAWQINDRKIRETRDGLKGRDVPLAMTECHFAIPGRNRCDVLSTWATGVSYGRILNNHQRHGDVLKIATAADFCGTRWQVNAVMMPTPHGKSYLMPVARVMKLYRHHIGEQAVEVTDVPDGLDVVASRTGDKLFLHVVNTNRDRAASAELNLAGATIKRATAFEIADDPMVEVSDLNSDDVMQIAERTLSNDGKWEFPAASVSAVEIELTG